MQLKTAFTLLLSTLLWLGLASHGAAAGGLSVLSISERSYQDGPALAVTVSAPLGHGERHDGYLSVRRGDGGAVSGGWVLSDDGRVLYFPNVDPETRYEVMVRPGLKAAGGETLAELASSTVTTRKVEPGFGFASRGSVVAGTR